MTPPVGPGAVVPSEDQTVMPMPEPLTPTTQAQAEPMYVETSPLEDFQVHFLVSLLFTSLYSYAAVQSLDALVQGTFPTELRQADLWVMVGLALGSSLAIALGSAGRVPDQSQPRVLPRSSVDPKEAPGDRVSSVTRVPLVRITY